MDGKIRTKRLSSTLSRALASLCLLLFALAPIDVQAALKAKTSAKVSSKKKKTKRVRRVVYRRVKKTRTKRKSDKLDLRWQAGLGGRSFSDEFGQAAIVQGTLRGAVGYKFHRSFETHLALNAAFESGSSVSLFETNQPTNGIYLHEAYAKWSPLAFLSLKGGALSQAFLATPQLVDATFPAAQLGLEIPLMNRKVKLSFIIQQALPTSTNLSTRVEDKEPLPLFSTQTALAEIKPHRDLKLMGHVSHFSFSELPEDVARQSLIHGNTILAPSETERSFEHDFAGWALGWKAHWRFHSKIALEVGSTFLRNTSAPDGVNQGENYFVQAPLRLSPFLTVSPRFEYFFNEPDVSPAFYNSALYGHNNMEGFLIGSTLHFKKWGFKLKGAFINRSTINLSDVQSDNKEFVIRWETDYGRL